MTLKLLCFFELLSLVIYLLIVFTVHNAPPPAPVQASSGGSILGGIGSTIAQGMQGFIKDVNV